MTLKPPPLPADYNPAPSGAFGPSDARLEAQPEPPVDPGKPAEPGQPDEPGRTE